MSLRLNIIYFNYFTSQPSQLFNGLINRSRETFSYFISVEKKRKALIEFKTTMKNLQTYDVINCNISFSNSHMNRVKFFFL